MAIILRENTMSFYFVVTRQSRRVACEERVFTWIPPGTRAAKD